MKLVSERMINYLNREITPTNTSINIKKVFQNVSMDNIALCAFGIDTNSFEGSSELGEKVDQTILGQRITKISESIVLQLMHMFPFIGEIIRTYTSSLQDYLYEITKNIISERGGDVSRGDFMDKLTEMLKDHKDLKMDGGPLTEDLILSQGIGFFMAGYETTSNALSTLTFNLSKHPEIQERIFEEVQKVVEECDGVIDSETIANLPYTEAVINENLRMYPPVTR